MRSGGLFAGYGGLDMAVAEVFGAEPAWFSEIEPGPSKILAHHWPTVPNHGDITTIDWDAVELVEILSGGFPCPDLSVAGLRAGLMPGTRSGLWSYFALAISKLRPRYVVIENVRGILSAQAHSDVEPCPWCLGEESGEPDLRALGAVLGDLADLGYDARWCGLRAANIGAPHPRYRIFVLAEDADVSAGSEWRLTAPGQAEGGRARPDAGGRDRAPVADASNNGRQGSTELNRGPVGGIAPSLGDDADGRSDAAADRDAVREQPVSQSWCDSEAFAGLAGADASERGGSSTAWGQYGPAIERWERILGRVAPSPKEPGHKGGDRLAPRFVEWMQGLPAGHVTDVPGVNRNAQLKALGNGVVPQQAIAALRHMHQDHLLQASA